MPGNAVSSQTVIKETPKAGGKHTLLCDSFCFERKEVSHLMNIVICTLKTWNIENARVFQAKYEKTHRIFIMQTKEELNSDKLRQLKPDYIFFPHWSDIIPKEIYETYTCIVFHMTDLPYGRGGSPLQNLIARGVKRTKISAIRVNGGLDAGPIYLKEDLELLGSALDIFQNASDIIFHKMIPYIIHHKPEPYEQTGEPVLFKRRTPKDSEILAEYPIEKIYDYIRMLDAEGYPPAFMRFGNYKLLFHNASLTKGRLTADVEIVEEENTEGTSSYFNGGKDE